MNMFTNLDDQFDSDSEEDFDSSEEEAIVLVVAAAAAGVAAAASIVVRRNLNLLHVRSFLNEGGPWTTTI